VQGQSSAFPEAATGVGKLHAHLVRSGRDCAGRLRVKVLDAEQILTILQLTALGAETPAADVETTYPAYSQLI
jgi:hypothetical protein